MCGIFGSVGTDVDESILATLRHRGPDGMGGERVFHNDIRVFLGHTRLAILDLSPAGHQPMRSRDGRWWVTFNGEIYNHETLRGKTNITDWRGHSDTETLVEMIAAFGVAGAVRHLNGMFAFGAFDSQEGKLYLVRDPFGIKPLYFVHQETRFAFASEVRALRAAGLIDGVDADGLCQFLALRYVPSPATLWRGVRRLPPGHSLCLDVSSGSVSVSCFIRPTIDRFTGTFDDAITAYHEQLSASVRRQLLSDVPVGILLSGGVDSALVAAMARDSGRNLSCYTVGFGAGHSECEIEDARETARVLGLPFHAVTVTPDDLLRALSGISESVEEPLGTTSIMPMWYLVERARRDVTVVLTGQGSDEPWGGYFRYQVEMVRQLLPLPVLWNLVRRMFGAWQGKPEAIARGLDTLSEHDAVKQVLAACALFSEDERQSLTGAAGVQGMAGQIEYWVAWLANGGGGGLSGVERMMRLDSRMNLADDLLLYGDKISMAVSLEARVPMLDLELVRFIESLPIDWRIRWGHGKVVHKAMAERYLPAEIVYRRKKGFQVPFAEWSRGPWRAWVEERLMEGLEGLLERKGIERVWRAHLTKGVDRSRQVFALLMLALWWERNR